MLKEWFRNRTRRLRIWWAAQGAGRGSLEAVLNLAETMGMKRIDLNKKEPVKSVLAAFELGRGTPVTTRTKLAYHEGAGIILIVTDEHLDVADAFVTVEGSGWRYLDAAALGVAPGPAPPARAKDTELVVPERGSMFPL